MSKVDTSGSAVDALAVSIFQYSPDGVSGPLGQLEWRVGGGSPLDSKLRATPVVRFSRIPRAFQSDKTKHINTHLKAFCLKTKVSTSRLLISSARHTNLSAGAPV